MWLRCSPPQTAMEATDEVGRLRWLRLLAALAHAAAGLCHGAVVVAQGVVAGKLGRHLGRDAAGR